MKLDRTLRGFAYANFTDRNDEACSIQDSSLATEDAIWLGVEHINAKEWSSVAGADLERIPARMHLTRDMAEAVAPTAPEAICLAALQAITTPEAAP